MSMMGTGLHGRGAIATNEGPMDARGTGVPPRAFGYFIEAFTLSVASVE